MVTAAAGSLWLALAGELSAHWWAVGLAAAAVAAISYLDDIRGIAARWRALVHTVAAIAVVAVGALPGGIAVPGGLIVAVFTLPFYNFYMARVSAMVREMETTANILIETMDEMDAFKA